MSEVEANGISDLRIELFSKHYYGSLANYSQSEFETAKILGQFYTHYNVADTMIDNLFEVLRSDFEQISIIDPFCGDGRLIVAFLRKIASANPLCEVSITVWDIDEKAVGLAKTNIANASVQYGIKVNVCAEVTDAFARYYEKQHFYDVCITNPPWSILKPQKSFTEQHNEEAHEEFKQAIALYDSYIKEEFSVSQPTAKFGKWGTNLARCGTEVALRLVKHNGYCSIVSPASLLSDQVSGKFRAWIFNHFCLSHINYYLAEAKLFGAADVNSVSLLFKSSDEYTDIQVQTFDSSLNSSKYTIARNEFEYIRDNSFIFPLETGISIISCLKLLDSLPTLGSSEIGLKFCRELDETRVHERLRMEGDYLFIKGYMIDRFSYNPTPIQYADTDKCVITESCQQERIVWRDVSRNSQTRRVKATIAPAKTIAGNSLGVTYLQKYDSSKLRYLLAIMNSIVFESQARALLVTNHVSAGVIKKIHIPVLKPEIESQLVPLVEKRLNGDYSVEPYIESLVALNYGLPIQMFLSLSKRYYDDNLEYAALCRVAEETFNGVVL